MIYPAHFKNFEKDCLAFLKLNKIKYKAEIPQKKIENLPTIIVSNHYTRPILTRKSIFTTVDSIITSAIITVTANKAYKRKVNWTVKANLVNKFIFFKIKPRSIQQKGIQNYNLIAINKNYPFGSSKELAKNLRKKTIVALYPEGKTSNLLRKPNKNFQKAVSYLVNNLQTLQIIPVSIFHQGGIYRMKFHRTINLVSKNRFPEPKGRCILVQNKVSRIVVVKIMDTIAQGLPLKLRSKYKSIS